jgi:hypothetical protein
MATSWNGPYCGPRSYDQLDGHAAVGCVLSGGGQHDGFWIHGGDGTAQPRKGDGQRPRPAAEVEDRAFISKTAALSDEGDKRFGIRHAMGRIEGNGRAKAAGFED